MKKMKTAITIRSFGLNLHEQQAFQEKFDILYINTTGRRLSEAELIEHLQGIEGVIAGTEPFTKEVIESLPALKIISRVGVGVDSIDADAAKRRGIITLTTPEAPAQAVAEHTLALILDLLKHISEYAIKIHQGDHSIEPGLMLQGKTVGIVGLGRIGSRVALLLEAFGCNILYHDPWQKSGVPSSWESTATLSEILMKSDIISLHLPPQEGGKPILDETSFNLVKKGVIIINTARGTLIDENSLINAVTFGQVGGAGLDVVPDEPYSGKLLEFPQVVITPHVASNTIESRNQMESEALKNLIKAAEGLK